MAAKEIKTKSLSDMKDKYIGKPGTQEEMEYEYELRMDVLGKMIKTARQERHMNKRIRKINWRTKSSNIKT